MPREAFVLKIQRDMLREIRDFREMGPVSRTSRELFGPEKLVVKLQFARFEKVIFLHAFNIRKSRGLRSLKA